jgi:hypothetical protein
MPTQISAIETQVRERLEELTPRHWTSAELTKIIASGIKDLWREIVNLKGEHYFVVDALNVSIPSGSETVLGVPNNVHKVYLIAPRNTASTSTDSGRYLKFTPIDYNNKRFLAAMSESSVSADNSDIIYYAITGMGGPASAPVIYIAPTIGADIDLRFAYIPTLGPLESSNYVPIPGEADNALIAWGVAYARAKERDDRAPDPAWLEIYGTEKQNLVNSLGLRQYQEPQIAEAIWEDYW